MGKQVDQGTRLETRLVKLAKMAGRATARREPKTGIKHEPDVWIPGKHKRPVLVWENWHRTPGKQKRTATRMVVISESHFQELMKLDKAARYGYHAQCKSTQVLGVRATFEGLVAWMKERT